jgi:hypothetical protein
MTTPDERAQAIVDTFTWDTRDSPYTVIEGDDGAVLIAAIAEQIRQAQAEVWAEVKQQCEIVLDIGKQGGG